jgi:hypothetical protein
MKGSITATTLILASLCLFMYEKLFQSGKALLGKTL